MAIHFDPVEILEAYYTKATVKKDSPRYKLAQERLEICNECEFNTQAKQTGIYFCSKCGCLIGGKVFSKHENPCPLKKWKCDQEYFNNISKRYLI